MPHDQPWNKLEQYDRKFFPGDAPAGLIVATFLIP